MSQLHELAKNVLKNNDRGRHTIPSDHLYPHMWAWDSALISLGWSFIDIDRALTEIECLLENAWQDGRVPHMVFDLSASDYFPSPESWGCETSSTISQPPIWAVCLEKLLERGADPSRVKALLPAIEKSHQFFYNQRDPLNWNLVAIAHPWESGMDNSPSWDPPMKSIDPNLAPPYKRVDQDKVGDPSERPSEEEYKRYMAIVDAIKNENFGPGPFAVYDPMMSSVLAMSEKALSRLSERFSYQSQAKQRGEKLAEALVDKLWNQQHCRFDYYHVQEKQRYSIDSIGTFFPLLIDHLAINRDALTTKLRENFWAEFPLSTVSKNSRDFKPRSYWRGPSWIIINWFFEPIFGEELVEKTTQLVATSGFREYYDSRNGDGLGAKNFSWSAALFLDLTLKES